MIRFALLLAFVASPALAHSLPVCSGGDRAERRLTCIVDGDTGWERGENEIDSTAEALIRQMAVEKLDLPFDEGIEELSLRSVPTAEKQTITINARNGGNDGYDLAA